MSDLLGRATLELAQILPNGFNGQLSLQSAGKGVKATLTVRVCVLEGAGVVDTLVTPIQPQLSNCQGPNIQLQVSQTQLQDVAASMVPALSIVPAISIVSAASIASAIGYI